MCAVYGLLNYGKKIPHKLLTRILREISVNAECRGTDATGISYVRNGRIVTFKKAKPAHKMKLVFPTDTTALIGHNRMTTQGDAKRNYNNHPFEGRTTSHSFSLAHNGVLYNDGEIQKSNHLPATRIETDTYVAVQLLEKMDAVDSTALKSVAETVLGSFVFTVLRDDNTLFLLKGDNPLTLMHFPEYGLYLYASTTEILFNAFKKLRFNSVCENTKVESGNIVRIDSGGKLSISSFDYTEPHYIYRSRRLYDWFDYGTNDKNYENDLLMMCGFYGVDSEDVELLLEYYSYDEVEQMLFDTDMLHEALRDVKYMLGEDVYEGCFGVF
ncbi:class II glutamine amidotransferase [Ruminococcus sp. XPD3002]|uniref:class II glutamine amidotransferase n=1 Tax=Ruminococcus sp. XPD3002 TaxID=1452269 RepID=UPI0009108EA6|nr:Glutamine amidotransferase domain-containing protein [Ruminococcus flavefaciens]